MREQFNESNRLLFVKGSNRISRYLFDNRRNIVSYVFFIIGLAIVFFGVSVHSYQKGFDAGTKIAIDPRHPSEALELACVGLWVGKQNQKYQK